MYFFLRKQFKFGSLSHNSDDNNLLLSSDDVEATTWLCCCRGQPLPHLPTRSEPAGIHRVTRTVPPFCSAQNALDEGPAQSGPVAGHRHHSSRALCCNRTRAENAAQAKTHKYGTNAAIWARRSVWRPRLAAEAGHMLSICVCGLGRETSLGADSDVTAEQGRGRERCSGLFRLPSFRPAAA